MANIIDYLQWRGDLPLAQYDFHEVDGVVLARLSYLPFYDIVPADFSAAVPLAQAAEALLRQPDLEQRVLQQADVALLRAVAGSRRFQGVKLSGYVDQSDAQTQTQFAAVTFRLTGDRYFAAFRGTDNTLVGWKEDFNMSFTYPVPAQETALGYVLALTRQVPVGKLLLGGHSKGGNLAVYAAAFCGQKVQDRIEGIYNFDGPGFDRQLLQQPSFRRIGGKIHTYVPQSSVVGMLLEHDEAYSIIQSNQTFLLQHDVYSWEVLRDQLVTLDSVTNSSRLVNGTLKELVVEMEPAQRERFIDTVYQVLTQTNVQTPRELHENRLEHAKIILQAIRNLDEQERKNITGLLRPLFRSARKSVVETFQKQPRQKGTGGGTQHEAEPHDRNPGDFAAAGEGDGALPGGEI